MRFIFKDKKIQKLYTDQKGKHKYPPEVIKAFFTVMAVIRRVQDERELYALRSLHYKALKGKRSHEHSIRLNKQWRLIVERAQDERGRYLWIINIEDYH